MAVLAPAIALSKATGLDTHVAVVLIYFVCIFYSSQGGMKAVVIADTFQVSLRMGSIRSSSPRIRGVCEHFIATADVLQITIGSHYLVINHFGCSS